MPIICDNDISFDELFEDLIFSNNIEICNSVKEKLEISRKVYEEEGKKGKVYGYSTSLGALINKEDKYDEGREDIILREHDTGIGKEAPILLVKMTMLIRLIQLTRGNSPIRVEVVERIKESLNKNIIPSVPLLGSVGASGDLAPLSRIFRCIILGEGEAYLNGKKVSCIDALKYNGFKPLKLQAGESLSLINSNAWSLAMALINTYLAENLVDKSLNIAKKSLLLTGCNEQHFSNAVYETRKQDGIKKVIEKINGSCVNTPRLQDPYSIRCIPQIYGALYDTIDYSKKILIREINSTSDNPIVYEEKIYHACQFHAIYEALVSDFLKTAIIPVMNSIERRISQMLDGKITGKNSFLLKDKSVVGAMILQYTAAALNSYSRGSSIPMSSHSIPTSGTQEDVVSMAPNASIELLKINDLFAKLISIENAINIYNENNEFLDFKDILNKSYNDIIKGKLENFADFLDYLF